MFIARNISNKNILILKKKPLPCIAVQGLLFGITPGY
jgi:hypothetical protein